MQQLQDIGDKIKDSGALPYLLSGGAGALVGGTIASGVRNRGESKLQRLGRILGTGAVSGLATAGTHKLLSYGLDQAEHALPKDDVSPEQEILSGNKTRGIAAGVTAAALTGKTHHDDKNSWRQLAKANPGVWGGSKDDKDQGFKSYSNFSHGRNSMVNDPAQRTTGNNKYKTFLDKQVGDPNDRKAIDVKLKSLGIDSTSSGFKSLDNMRYKHLMGSYGKTGMKLADFVLRNEGKLLDAKNTVMPAITKLTGRSPMRALGRAAMVGGAAAFPEVLSGLGEQITGSNDDTPAL